MGKADRTPVSLRQWVTGQIPDKSETVITTPLPEPLYHDTPSIPETYWGKPCMVKACAKADKDTTRSLRFRPSGLCVACWQRWDKHVTRDEDDDAE
jgi:hypothetical protein